MKPSELRGRKIRVYDIECKNQVDNKTIGWKDYDLMGISVLTIFDYEDGDYKVFFDNELGKAVELLNGSELVVGFNICGFDNALLRTFRPELKKEDELNCYDIYLQSKLAVGAPEERPKGLRLDDHLKASLGMGKTANGWEAPLMYQNGRMGELVSYNIADVRRERMLFEHVVEKGTVSTEAYGTYNIPHPSLYLRGMK